MRADHRIVYKILCKYLDSGNIYELYGEYTTKADALNRLSSAKRKAMFNMAELTITTKIISVHGPLETL